MSFLCVRCCLMDLYSHSVAVNEPSCSVCCLVVNVMVLKILWARPPDCPLDLPLPACQRLLVMRSSAHSSVVIKWQQEISYRKQIARQLRTQFVEGISVTLKSTLRVTQGHWKRNHWTDHTRLTIRWVIERWIISWPWNVGQRSLKIIESGTIWNFGYGFLTFPTLNLTLTLVKVIENFTVR